MNHMNRRLRTAAFIALAMVGATAIPGTASATPLHAQDSEPAECTVSAGIFTWGVKESFRAYIGGSIANGSWSEADGASYETPNFSWSEASGSFNPTTGAGTVSFKGSVHFTGHDGVLDLTLANPTLEFESGGETVLLLDTRSTDVQGNLAVDATQEWVGDVKIDGGPRTDDGRVKIEAAPTTLTNSGAKAFAGFYQAGIELDPITADFTLEGCDVTAVDASPANDSEAVAAGDRVDAVVAEPRVPWWPIGIGGAALLAIGFTSGTLLAGSRRSRPGNLDQPSGGASGAIGTARE